MPVVLYVLFVLALLPILVAWIGAWFRKQQFGHFDNHHPRIQQGLLTGAGARAVGAQANSWEALQIFMVVVFIAYATGVDLARLGAISLVFLALRVIYIALYLMNQAWLRSVVYALGMLCCFYIFGIAVMQGIA